MRKFLFMIIIATGVFYFVNSASAIDADHNTSKLSLSEAIEMAVVKNFLIKESSENLKGAVAEKKSAWTEFFPKASATYSYTGLSEDPYQKIWGLQTVVADTDQYHWDLTITQPLFTGFALSNRYNIAKLGVETKQIEKRLAILDVIKKVKIAYFNILLTKKYATVAEESVNNLKSHENNAEKFYEQGMIPYNDLLRSKVALADAVQNREKAKARVKIAVSVLNILLAKDIHDETDVEDILSIPSLSYNLSELVKESLENRPELKVLRLAIRNLDHATDLVKSSYYPQVAMVGRYEQNGDNITGTNNDFGNSYNSSLTLQATWTFFEWGKTRADAAKYRYNKSALVNKMKGIEDGIKLEVKNAFLNLQVAEKNIQTAKESQVQAKENWRITNLQYQQQMATSTDVLDARTFLTQAETNYYGALYGYMISLAELEMAAGKM